MVIGVALRGIGKALLKAKKKKPGKEYDILKKNLVKLKSLKLPDLL